jgi:hypothetical protein
MGFWTIFWPTFAALLSAMLVLEVFHIGLNYAMLRHQSKKATKAQKEAQAKLAASLGITPEEIQKKVEAINNTREELETRQAAALFEAMPAEGILEIPTVSGEAVEKKKEEHNGQGQYL